MKSARIAALMVLVFGFIFNEWAFRFIFPIDPIDSFLRLMTVFLDVFIGVFVLTFLWTNDSFGNRIQHVLRHHSKLLLIYLSCFMTYCLLLSVEFACRYFFKHIYQAPYSEHTYWEPNACTRDSILGTALLKDTVFSHAYVVNDSLIYKQYYRTDEFGRRIIPPSHPDSAYTEFAMVTGCSFAFGYGLPERETLSFFLDSITGNRGYNYGVSGHGTQQTLAILQSRNLHSEINEPNGVLIHLFIDDHINRLIGSRRLIKLWAKHFPYYYLENGEPKRNGSFWTGRQLTTRFYRAISQSAFIDLFDIDIPWFISNEHMELFAAVLKESQKEFLKQYPEGKFLVVIGPNCELAGRAIFVLERNNLDVLDLSSLLDKDQKRYRIHWTEAHPNANYYREMAKAIDGYLKD
ncbi:MAG: hypothetical protein RL266_1266 [Bacteroidota bacterium]|jgi:hypothetical protein